MADPLAAALRLSLYAALGLLFGLSAFGLHAFPAGAGREWSRATARFRGRLALLALALTAAALVDLIARMHGLPIADVGFIELQMVLQMPGIGLAFLARVFALAVTWFVLACWPQGRWTATFAAAAAMTSLVWLGHAAATDGRAGLWHLVATAIHLLAAGLWVGALAAFAWLASQPDARRVLLPQALARFHMTGTVLVAALLLTGSVSLVLIAGWPLDPALLKGGWGKLLAAKLMAFLAMLGLATLNRFRLVPAYQKRKTDLRPLQISLGFEFALSLVVLALVAWAGLLAPEPA